MGHAGRASVAASLVVGLAVGGLGAGILAHDTAFAGDAAKVKEYYDGGMKALEQGDYPAALEKFKMLFQEDPTQDQVVDLIRGTESRHLLKMLTAGGEYQLAAQRLMELGHSLDRSRSRDGDAIRGLVETAIKEGDIEKRRMASRSLMANHGAFAVPHLVNYLGSNDTEERVRAIMALEDIGIEAVLPLCESLNSADAQVRQNALIVLKRLGDPRALGYMAWMAAAKDQPEGVRKAAVAGLESIRASSGMKAGNAHDAFLDAARLYYLRSPELMRDLGGAWTLWSWSGGKLEYKDVPRLMYHLRLAEGAALMAAKADAGSGRARAVLGLTYAAQAVALHGAGAEFRDSDAGKAEATRLAGAEAGIRSGGAAAVQAALGIAMEWGDGPVAVHMLGTLPAFGAGVSLDASSSVVKALTSEDGAVRWAAAICCTRLSPRAAFPRCELVPDLLSQAIAVDSIRQILIIEPDTKTAVTLQTDINAAGMHAVVARSGAQGLIFSKQARYDAVLVSSGLKDLLAQSVANEIKRDARTAGVPVLVVAPESAAESIKGLMGDSIANVVTMPLSAGVYVPMVREAANGSPLNDRAHALAVSEAACAAAAGASAGCIDLTRTAAALVSAASSPNKPEGLKLQALAALKKWGGTASLKGLIAVVADSGSPEAVRAGAAEAAGLILNGNSPTTNGFETLLGGLSDGSVAVRTACAGALGSAKLTAEQRAMVLEKAKL